jgi:hypothetical protein
MARIEMPPRRVAIGLVGLAALAAPIPAFSQNCALCYTQAASAGARFIEALRSGILVLIIPPMLMSVGMMVLAYRKRNQFKNDTPESDRTW